MSPDDTRPSAPGGFLSCFTLNTCAVPAILWALKKRPTSRETDIVTVPASQHTRGSTWGHLWGCLSEVAITTTASGGVQNRNLFSCGSGGQRSEIKVPAELGSLHRPREPAFASSLAGGSRSSLAGSCITPTSATTFSVCLKPLSAFLLEGHQSLDLVAV